MSLPYAKFVPISAKVQSPAFTVEKKHMLLAMDNALIGTATPFIEYTGASALNNFRADFGTEIPEYTIASKYFAFNSKTGGAPEKLVVARWYKTSAAPFVRGTSDVATLAQFQATTDASFVVDMSGTSYTLSVDLSSVTSLSDVAQRIQAAINNNTAGGAAFTGATVAYNTVVNAFVITSGATGAGETIAVSASDTGTNALPMLGLTNATVSAGANAETFAEFCDRIYNANSAGYSITTAETLDNDEITAAVAWLQGSVGNQTLYSAVRLVFNITDKATAKALQSTLQTLSYTGYVVCYDPYGEYVNALDCAICATIDYQVANGAINFNFQPAVGYTPITTVGDVVNYQAGQTNLSLAEELDALCISYVYSVGFGTQQQVLYGMGLMQGMFGTEDVQVNESALELDLQTTVMNGFVTLNKLKLQGTDARGFIDTMITPVFERFVVNGSIARNGTLSESDKNSIFQATDNEDAAGAVEQNGYYFQVQPLTAEDISLRRVRILVAYLCGGVINQLRITNNLYGA